MALGDKLAEQTAGLGAALDKRAAEKRIVGATSAPAQLLMFKGQMVEYEATIAGLKAQLAESKLFLPVDLIDRNPWQPRKLFDNAAQTELAASIKVNGLIQPVVVRLVVDGPNVRYQLVAGERRLRAYKLNNEVEIQALIVEASDADMAAWALVENINRADLSDFEIGAGISVAESEFPSRSNMAIVLGVSRTQLYRYLSFQELPAFALLDLELNPRILGGNAAMAIVTALESSGEHGLAAFTELWPQVVAGTLDQTQVANLILSEVISAELSADMSAARSLEAAPVRPIAKVRDTRNLFLGKKPAGSITKDGSNFVIKIKTPLLDAAQEAQLRDLVDQLFKVSPKK